MTGKKSGKGNCGTGDGGFKPGNACAATGKAGKWKPVPTPPDKTLSKAATDILGAEAKTFNPSDTSREGITKRDSLREKLWKTGLKSPFPELDLTIPYSKHEDIPFTPFTSKGVSSYLHHQAQVLAEPRLIKYARSTEYDSFKIPIGEKRRLGLLAYEKPPAIEDLERVKKIFSDSGHHTRAFPNFTIFKDAKGNHSAAWGDKEKVKFLISKFSSNKGLRSLKEEDHRKLGKWFGYKSEAIDSWIGKNKLRQKSVSNSTNGWKTVD
jgi:hypothetical protein